ncbi:hypothetical protein [Clostridium folliculivorans]|uniref:Lipoprotein n=1 Tax=Clostridium folliculivorans TaxID=2886038 RepID=A0A9W6DBJ5_9CLOT|nr:hypothetical protein [Clostridium folliculivorans]GKU26041.1 hypothetical protein CFOLD11_28680 [Clostridium folliculivorans]GKU28127.1 hypothetical protein CFB3_02330 [Clostridium folliculivorans]
MKKRRLFVVCILVIATIFVGCKKSSSSSSGSSSDSLVNEKQAIRVAENYMKYLSRNDYENARKLCSSKLANKTQELQDTDLSVVDFSVSEINQSGKSAIIKAKVNRLKQGVPRADIDTFSIKVSKQQGDVYEIDEVKAETLVEAFVEGESIKLKAKDEPKAKLVISMKDLPKDMYPKTNEANILKKEIPAKEFTAINFTISGQRMGISTKDGNRSFVGVLEVEDAVPTASSQSGGSSGGGEGQDQKQQEDSDKKPLAKKVKAVDIYDNGIVQKIMFSQDENYMAVQYLENNVANRLKAYSVASGSMLEAEFDKIFPTDKYELVFSKFTKTEMFFEVKGVSGRTDVRQDVLGMYKLDFKELKIDKV